MRYFLILFIVGAIASSLVYLYSAAIQFAVLIAAIIYFSGIFYWVSRSLHRHDKDVMSSVEGGDYRVDDVGGGMKVSGRNRERPESY